MKATDKAIHVVVACSLMLAVGALSLGYGSQDLNYLILLMAAVNACLLAGILFVLERLLRKTK